MASTPGPWHLWPEGGRAPDDAYPIFSAEGWSIARVKANGYPTMRNARDEDEANARLIAQAPALVEALREAVEQQYAWLTDHGALVRTDYCLRCEANIHHASCYIPRLEAVLAAALGQDHMRAS